MKKFDIYLKKGENDQYMSYFTTVDAENMEEAQFIANNIAKEMGEEEALEIENVENAFVI